MSEESPFNLQGYNIVTILKRLEAATSRLEDVTIFQAETGNQSKAPNAQKSINSNPTPASDADESVVVVVPEPTAKPKSIVEFQNFITDNIAPFVETSKGIDSIVGEAAGHLQKGFEAQLEFLNIASKTKKPDFSNPRFMELLAPINQEIQKISEIQDANRKSEFYNHLSTLGEGAPVLAWILSDTPVSAIPEYKDSAQFWSNRIMKDFKEKDPKHAQWVKQFLSIFEALKVYVKEFHTTGASWNANGKSLEEILDEKNESTSVPAAPPAPGASAGGPPPPPPPPPPPSNLFEEQEKPAGGMNAVFADLNRGENITSGLKKVDKSEMTHKNPELRKQAPPVAKKPAPPKKPTSLSSGPHATAPKKKPAKKELVDGSKWIIENFTESDVSAQTPIVIEVEMSQSVFIGNCSGVTIQIKGKANAISVSETKNCGIVIDSLISGIDFIKSFKFGLQVVGTVYMISVDKCDEGSIYLSAESAEVAQIFTSSTTALNVNVPDADDYTELAIPEQFKHTFKDGKIISEVVEHAG
ncbi:adenylyl cyclase-associated protein [[Candida] anglica]